MNNSISGIMPIDQFLEVCGITELQFLRGKGRAFAQTPAGSIFVAGNYDPKKPAFVVKGGADLRSEKGESLEGTLWLCNSTLQVTNLKFTRQPRTYVPDLTPVQLNDVG
jgi:hypothetical protein